MAEPKIILENVSMTYYTLVGETPAIKNLSFQIQDGEFVGIVGPSGCGKSTLLSLITGLIKPTKGRILIDKFPVLGTSPKISYMLQQDYLFEWRTILNNCLLGPEIQGMNLKTAQKKVLKLLEKYGLQDFAHFYPHQLSGGMRQRVALIRTLATNPSILLLDEPFSSLDYQTKLTLENEVSTILREENKTVLLVTHDISEAISMCDKIIVLTNRPANLKSEHKIKFARENSIFKIRELPSFHEYFKIIWKELHENEKALG